MPVLRQIENPIRAVTLRNDVHADEVGPPRRAIQRRAFVERLRVSRWILGVIQIEGRVRSGGFANAHAIVIIAVGGAGAVDGRQGGPKGSGTEKSFCLRFSAPGLGKSALQPKAVPHAGFGQQESWPGGIGLDLLAELVHVDAEVMAFLAGAGAPDFVKELAVGHDLVGVFHQHAEQAVFVGSQMNRLAVDMGPKGSGTNAIRLVDNRLFCREFRLLLAARSVE